METIHFVDPCSYFKIYQNRKYFISHDIIHSEELIKSSLDTEDFNKEGKAFFESLFSHNANLKELLATLFPYVYRYTKHEELKGYSYPDANKDYIDISNNMRICSAKYFDLYFTYSSNNFLEISNDIDNFLRNLSDLTDYDSTSELLNSFLVQIPFNNQKEWFEQLESRINLYNKSNFYYLAKALFSIIYDIDNSMQYLQLNAMGRCELIISQILDSCTDSDFSDFLSTVSREYGKINVICNIVYWMDKYGDTNMASSRQEQLKKICFALCETVLDKKINLYSNKYYHSKNIWGIYKYCKETHSEIFKPYILSIVSELNIYRILWDITECGIGSGYSYSISNEKFHIFFDNVIIVENYLNNAPPKTEYEKFIYKIYKSFKNDVRDLFGRKDIITTDYINPTL